jgi:hypothetical protein
MTLRAETLSSLVRNVWVPELYETLFYNDYFFGGEGTALFKREKHLGGSVITAGYNYANTTSVGTYSYDSTLIEPFYTSQTSAYHNVDHYMEVCRISNVYLDYLQGSGSNVSINGAKGIIETGMKNLRDKITTSILADLVTDVDTGSSYSDASKTRATYNMVSYEETTGAAISLAYMEALVDAVLGGTTYGTGVRSINDLVLFMAVNQARRLASLGGHGAAYNATFNMVTTSMDSRAPIDVGALTRTKTFEGIPVYIIKDFSANDILLLHKPDVVITETRPFTVTEKDELLDTQLYLLTAAYNGVVRNPINSAKLSNKTT